MTYMLVGKYKAKEEDWFVTDKVLHNFSKENKKKRPQEQVSRALRNKGRETSLPIQVRANGIPKKRGFH